MKLSRALMDRAGVTPKLRLGNKTAKGAESTGPHRVKLLEDKIIKGTDPESRKEIEYVVYIVEERGEKKQYKTRLKKKGTDELSYLVQRLSEYPEGSEVILEMKRAGIQNYIEVTPIGSPTSVEVDEHDDGDDIQA